MDKAGWGDGGWGGGILKGMGHHMNGRGLRTVSLVLTVGEYLQCYPDQCEWLPKICLDQTERLGDMVSRIGFEGEPAWVSAVTCMLDDERILGFLPAGIDLHQVLSSRLPELKAAALAYQDAFKMSPCPYVLFREVFGDAKDHRIPPQARQAVAGRIVGSDSATTVVDAAMISVDPRTMRVTHLAMRAAQRVGLVPHEAFSVISNALRLMESAGLTDGASLKRLTLFPQETFDPVITVAFLVLAAECTFVQVVDGDETKLVAPSSNACVEDFQKAACAEASARHMFVCNAKCRIINAIGGNIFTG